MNGYELIELLQRLPAEELEKAICESVGESEIVCIHTGWNKHVVLVSAWDQTNPIIGDPHSSTDDHSTCWDPEKAGPELISNKATVYVHTEAVTPPGAEQAFWTAPTAGPPTVSQRKEAG